MTRRILLAATFLAVALNAVAQERVQAAIEARAAGAWARAIELLRAADRAEPSSRTKLLLGETLAWNKQYDEAAEIYEIVLRAEPGSRSAAYGLARVRLWQGRYAEARRLFSALVERDGADTASLEGLATAAYWSGDYRTAEREFRRLDTDFARRSLAELRSASRTTAEIDVDHTNDDQPLHSTRTAIRGSTFTDPLTRWDGAAGAYRISSTAGGSHQLPFAIVGNETALPAARLTFYGSLGGIRTPQDQSHVIGSAGVRVRLWSHSTLALSLSEREIVTNATRRFPFVRSASLRWQQEGRWLASLGAERLHYSDKNDGTAADGYVLLPLFTGSRWTIRGGASALYRDTREPRFYVDRISSVRDSATGLFLYTYHGTYDPYWSPIDLVEGRAIIGIERKIGASGVVRLQGDAGRARDEGVGFWPHSGNAPFPGAIGTARFHRSFAPRRLRLSVDTPLAHAFFLNLGFEHGTTAYYEANTVHATVGRRR